MFFFSNETTCPDLNSIPPMIHPRSPGDSYGKKHGQDSHDFGLLKLPVFSFIAFSSMMTCTPISQHALSWLSNHQTFFFWRRNTSANWSEQLSVSVLWTTMDWPPVSNSPTLNRKKGISQWFAKNIWEKPGPKFHGNPVLWWNMYFGFIWPVSVKVDMSEFLGRYVMGKYSA